MSHRILTMTTMLFGVVVGSVFLFFGYEASQIVVNLMLFVAASTVVALFLMCYLSLKPLATMKIAALILRFLSFVSRGRWELSRLELELAKALKAFHLGMRILTQRPKNLLVPFFFSAVSFLLDLSIPFFVLFSLGFPASLSLVLVVYTIVNAIQTIPLGIPGEVGVTDVAMTSLYYFLGIPAGISGTATLLTRVLTVWLRIFVGYAAVQWMGIAFLRGRAHSHSVRAIS